ncbi:hypothetical protein RAJCM14343_4183 [Rhodococcus aetherivorans]|uniref:Uncharacterized protein n=1 Tax=Rhodococcus aetherivorans TaxID=191292 RepID=A0ABQ0YR82_9NOCA|nr:hypothetical protein RAJCM14343_4183 [Rhodococcus aetherivorans]CCW12038.1 hypothetical protein EBESD8_25840 [Rhodococcus aetherivorans]
MKRPGVNVPRIDSFMIQVTSTSRYPRKGVTDGAGRHLASPSSP